MPTINVSMVDASFVASRETSAEEVTDVLREAAASGKLKGILAVCAEPLVSMDFNHDRVTSAYDAFMTRVSVGNSVLKMGYHTGACIYSTMGFSGRGLARADEIYQCVEHRLREVILEHGGPLSHHHGVGKVRQAFVPRVHSPEANGALRAVKQRLDPNNVFGAGNNCFGGDS